MSFAKNKSKYGAPVNEIPVGVDPQLDALAFGYQSIFKALPLFNSQSITLGTRWDVKSNGSLGTQVLWGIDMLTINEQQTHLLNIKDRQSGII